MGLGQTGSPRSRSPRHSAHGQLTRSSSSEYCVVTPSGQVAVSASVRSRSSDVGGGVDASRGSVGGRWSSFIVSHELPLDRAPEAYEHFDARDDGWTKVVLHPGMSDAGA